MPDSPLQHLRFVGFNFKSYLDTRIVTPSGGDFVSQRALSLDRVIGKTYDIPPHFSKDVYKFSCRATCVANQRYKGNFS